MYQIAIPSYNRPEKICKYSLDLLKRHNISFDCLTIFLHTKEQKLLYEKSLNKYFPNTKFNIHITNQVGIGKTRTYIRRYYDDDTKVFFLDDDMKEVLEKGEDKCNDLHKLICTGFTECIKENATLWGISYYDNKFYMKDTITTTLKYIAGGICGVIVNKDVKEFDVEIDQWEDYLFSIKHFMLDGKVIRLNKYGIVHKPYDPDGGICSAMGGRENRIKVLEESAIELCKQYPNAMKVCYNKGKLPNIRLNWRYKVN
jgi:hypothetical protein